MTTAPRTPLLVGVAAAAALGGVLAVLSVAVTRTIIRPGLVGGAVLVVTALCLLAAVAVSSTSGPPAPDPQPQPQPRPADPRPLTAVPAAAPVGPPPATPERGSRYVEIPLRELSAGERPVRQLAQCPRCGDFALGVRQLRHELGFDCHACGHAWYWAPDRPWPVTVVRPGLAAARPASPVAPSTWRLKA